MGSLGDSDPPTAPNATSDPVLAQNVDVDEIGHGGAVGEPLVLDFQDESHLAPASNPPGSEPQSPDEKPTDFQPLSSHPIASPSTEDAAPPPPDFTRRGIHIPTRTSSKTLMKRTKLFRSSSNPVQMAASMSSTPESRERSSADSVLSYETTASSVESLVMAPLQQKGPPSQVDRLSPLLEDDPKSFDLLAPNEGEAPKGFSVEDRSDLLFSKDHLQAIFDDTPSLLRFTSFLSATRPKSVPVLIYYLDALKALRAINYANAVAEALEPLESHEFTAHPARPTINSVLEEKAKQAFDVLVREDLPAFITHIFVQVVSVSIQKRITGTLPPLLREASEGLAEVFCLTDPSRPDNPIIFASEEFHRTTQYGVSYAIGRNCRFLQGPRTNRNSVARLRKAVEEGREISETFLNYRRDGSPFVNLLTMAPLLDSRGNLRYIIGAQVDVTGLVKDCTDLDALKDYLRKQQEGAEGEAEEPKDEFQELSEMFNITELDTVRKYGGSMHREHLEERDDASMYHKPRILLKDPASPEEQPIRVNPKADGRLAGVYKNYILVRPAPSLRILFTSPSLRVPGILQSRFLDRIGGSTRVRDSLAEALTDGTRGVTAKIRWLSSPTRDPERGAEEGRPRWIHCTPLLGGGGSVGVWMVVLVNDEKDSGPSRKFRTAPPIAREIRPERNWAESRTQMLDGSDDEDDYHRFTARDARDRVLRHPAVESIRRPSSVMSDQRVYRSASPSQDPSIHSFALN